MATSVTLPERNRPRKWVAVSTWSDGRTSRCAPGSYRAAQRYARRMRDVALVCSVTEPMLADRVPA